MKFSGRLLQSAAHTKGGRLPLSHNFNRLFSSARIPNPHSEEHLRLQQKLFKIQNIPANITTLPIGTELIGLNITPVEPHYLGTAPVYNLGILNAISHSEKEEWLEMSKTHYAQLGKYELLCDVNCITSSSENGIPIHYIDHGLLDVKSYTPIEKLLRLDRFVPGFNE